MSTRRKIPGYANGRWLYITMTISHVDYAGHSHESIEITPRIRRSGCLFDQNWGLVLLYSFRYETGVLVNTGSCFKKCDYAPSYGPHVLSYLLFCCLSVRPPDPYAVFSLKHLRSRSTTTRKWSVCAVCLTGLTTAHYVGTWRRRVGLCVLDWLHDVLGSALRIHDVFYDVWICLHDRLLCCRIQLRKYNWALLLLTRYSYAV